VDTDDESAGMLGNRQGGPQRLSTDVDPNRLLLVIEASQQRISSIPEGPSKGVPASVAPV
jgi:hypothetical protein